MFSGCSNLESVYLSNFNTTQTEKMSYMFNGCLLLKSLDLSNFNIQNVIDMSFMFNKCKNLIYLNLSNFGTSKVNNMSNMFSGCTSLNFLDLSNFNTPDINDMSFMFYDCSSLISTNLSNFHPLKANNITYMFYNCQKSLSLNLSNLDTSETKNMNNLFYGCSMLTSLDISNFNVLQVENMNNMFFGCSNLTYINLKNSDITSNLNIYNNFPLNNQNLMICTEKENNIFLEILGEKIIYYCDDNHLNIYNCYMKNLTIYNIYNCDICQNDFIFKYNNSKNNYSYINCFEPKIILCYNSCETCEIEGDVTNNNCIKCKDKFIYEFNISNSKYKNYYINAPFDIDFQQENRTEKIQNIIKNLIREFNFTNGESGKDIKIVDNEKTIIFTSTENQRNNEEHNYITMDLGECEKILKTHYHIEESNSLFILQIISEEKGMKIPKMEYEVYYPLYGDKNLTKLNLTLCDGQKVEISISVEINEALDLYNPSSDYYNDICTITTSQNGTDIPLKDRRTDFVNNNLSLCEEKCELIEYNKEKKKVKCSCDMKLSINSNYDTKFNKDDFFKSFTDIKNIINLNVMKCYKVILKIKNIKKNYGFFIMFAIIILYFFTLFIFPNASFKKLKKEIKTIVWAIKMNETQVNKIKLINKPEIITKKIMKKGTKTEIFKSDTKLKKQNHRRKLKIIDKSKDNTGKSINPKEKEIINEKNKKIYEILKKNYFELNSLDYDEGKKIDQRSYCEYYSSLLENSHPILFSFSPHNDYNSKTIKFFLFFFSFGLDFTVNALFFTDDTMHKIHQDKGKFDFFYQIPQIIYSLLISRCIDTLIKKFALSQEYIVELKQVKSITKKQQEKLLRILKIKFTFYFIFTFIIIIFFLYYITCFCGIYINTQIHLIKDSFISLVTSLLIPFVLCIIPGIFRIVALKTKKANRKNTYKLSCILESLLC